MPSFEGCLWGTQPARLLLGRASFTLPLAWALSKGTVQAQEFHFLSNYFWQSQTCKWLILNLAYMIQLPDVPVWPVYGIPSSMLYTCAKISSISQLGWLIKDNTLTCIRISVSEFVGFMINFPRSQETFRICGSHARHSSIQSLPQSRSLTLPGWQKVYYW